MFRFASTELFITIICFYETELFDKDQNTIYNNRTRKKYQKRI